ncbi:hypothetical protein EZ456_15230 [Pedobacter psychrodurus]|uniref:Uncharacterized protein n=1 Tax=Pedobacter psychrodurus TaxID=2530456 RepID=A0A4R0PU94_9SPHI|nr:hypothetical protein [Pedobacter psychrodurus]TCD25608.1 hypothetical protein EZ456_15230 [Pedobacter psychrodurus]
MKNLSYKLLCVLVILIASVSISKAQYKDFYVSGRLVTISLSCEQNGFGGQYYENNQVVGEWVGGDFVITAKYENGDPFYGDLDFDVNIKREENGIITDDNTEHLYMSGGSYTLLYNAILYDQGPYTSLYTWVSFP